MITMFGRYLLAAVFAVTQLSLAMPAVAYAATPPAAESPRVSRIDPPKKVLFVGNSFTYYNNNLGGKFIKLVREADKANRKSYKWRAMTISAARLVDHIYGIQAINDPWGKKTRLSTKWDVVVLQGHSTEPIRAKTADVFKSAARELHKVIKQNGAKTAFFMTWAFAGQKGMTSKLRNAYTAIGNELNALVVPVGLAFQQALKERPGAALFAKDKKHPSLMGTYLAACVFYGSFYSKSPEGNTYTAGLSQADASFLQSAAWKAVKQYYQK